MSRVSRRLWRGALWSFGTELPAGWAKIAAATPTATAIANGDPREAECHAAFGGTSFRLVYLPLVRHGVPAVLVLEESVSVSAKLCSSAADVPLGLGLAGSLQTRDTRVR